MNQPSITRQARDHQARALLAAALGLSLVVTPTLAVSQGAAPGASASASSSSAAPVSSAAREEAKLHFERGLTLFREEAWSAALAEFLLSRSLFVSKSATQNAAISLRKLQRYDEAIEMFEAELREFANLSDEERAFIKQQLDELKNLVGQLVLGDAPDGSVVLVDGKERGKTPLAGPLRVSAGSHAVRVVRDGFLPFEARVDVAGGEQKRVQVRLDALQRAGRLKVAEWNGKTADVLLDGAFVGRTPWEGAVAPGPHHVQLRGPGDLGAPPSAVRIEYDQTAALILQMEPLASELRVEPTPPTAVVTIDGVSVGAGPWEGRLKPGEHRVEVAAEGFVTSRQTVTLVAQRREVIAAALVRNEPRVVALAPRALFFVEALGGVALPLAVGGDLAGTCVDGCSTSRRLSPSAGLRVGYQGASGLLVGAELGFFSFRERVQDRPGTLTPTGVAPNRGTLRDDLAAQAFSVGVVFGYNRGKTWRWQADVGAGLLLGSWKDERVGRLTTNQSPPLAYQTNPVVEESSLRSAFLAPEIRGGYRFSRSIEAFAAVQALVLLNLQAPSWRDENVVVAGVCARPPADCEGPAKFGQETLAGTTSLAVAPRVGLRLDF